MRFILLAAIVGAFASASFAQRGGGGGSHISGSGAGHSFAASHSTGHSYSGGNASLPGSITGSLGTGITGRPGAVSGGLGFRNNSGLGSLALGQHSRYSATHRYNRRLPYTWGFWPFGYAADYSSGDSYVDPNAYDSGYPPDGPQQGPPDSYLSAQVARLSDQLDRLQNDQEAQQTPPAAQSVPQPPPPQVPVTLVLRDGRQREVQNYAVMDQTFWDFSDGKVVKIPVANIDVDASIRATQSKGGDFPKLSQPGI